MTPITPYLHHRYVCEAHKLPADREWCFLRTRLRFFNDGVFRQAFGTFEIKAFKWSLQTLEVGVGLRSRSEGIFTWACSLSFQLITDSSPIGDTDSFVSSQRLKQTQHNNRSTVASNKTTHFHVNLIRIFSTFLTSESFLHLLLPTLGKISVLSNHYFIKIDVVLFSTYTEDLKPCKIKNDSDKVE